MVWTVKVTKTASKQLTKLDKIAQKRIILFLRTKIENTSNPRQQGKALRGNQAALWRYRVGDYRIICRLDDKTITVLVLAMGHRKEIYRP